MTEAYLVALGRELAGYEASGKTVRAAAVKAEMERVRKVLRSVGLVETTAASPSESAGPLLRKTAPRSK